MKHSARKVRRIAGGTVLAGFAGSAADGITLLEKFEGKLSEYKGNIVRAAVELAKDWRQDRALRRLEALLVVGDAARAAPSQRARRRGDRARSAQGRRLDRHLHQRRHRRRGRLKAQRLAAGLCAALLAPAPALAQVPASPQAALVHHQVGTANADAQRAFDEGL